MVQSKLTYGPIEKDEAESLWEIIYQSLHRHAQPGWNEHVGHERFRAVKSESKILGGMGIIDMGQWFGGKIVRTGAVTSVGVAPEGRGVGAASVLLRNSLAEMYESGIPISTLFPSSTRVYRSFGYERSGTKFTYETKVKDMKSPLNDLDVIETKAGDREETYLLYNERAASGNGNLDRGSVLWDLILETEGRKVFHYVVMDGDKAVGYVNFQQARSADHIRIRDMVALNSQCAERLLRFFYDHRTVIDTISWNGPPNDPIRLLMEEQEVDISYARDWMLRIVNIKKALESRGYPKDIEMSFTLNYEDPILPQNSGNWKIEISEGKGKVSKSESSGLNLGPRGLAPLYTSYLSAFEVKNMGLLSGTNEELAKASLVFSGSKPWIGDQF
tara:strand:+ start:3276 stop:4439 length:1164 start_codon:yes stop_codon:yes gene_type:complete